MEIRERGANKVAKGIADGPGFVPDQLPDDGMSHTGIINVRQRLERICGGELRVLSGPDQGTDAAIILPK